MTIIAARAARLEQLRNEICVCQLCMLAHTRTNAVPGEGPVDAQVMFVGEAPGKVNDATGRPFVGHGGRIFDIVLERLGLSRSEVFVTNAVKCWPPENRKPSSAELAACNNYLAAQISLLSPRLLVALGKVAFKAVTGRDIRLKAEHGILTEHDGIPIVATYHPNSIRYVRGGVATIVKDLDQCLKQVLPRKAQGPAQASLFNEIA